MKNFILLVLVMSLSIAFCFNVRGNNLQISNAVYNNVSQEFEFDISWDNSWRQNSNIPYNYDGVWVFIKVRKCADKYKGVPGDYKTAWLSTDSLQHTINSSNFSLLIEPGRTDISSTERGVGVFLYRENISGSNSITASVSLKWELAAQAAEMSEIEVGAEYDIKVFGVEMVYIPEGPFYLGDGASSSTFYDASAGTGTPYYVQGENGLLASGTTNAAIDTIGGTGTAISDDYPKGFNSFWIMKYEITQKQYADFLTCLTPDQAQNRTQANIFTINNTTYVISDNGNIRFGNAVALNPSGNPMEDYFGVDLNGNGVMNEANDGTQAGCNFLSVRDALAFFDWAGLRPISEFEYEKASRGPVVHQADECAWGSAGFTLITGLNNAGTNTESATNTGNGLTNANQNLSGPARVGISATAGTNRLGAGASYYGVMDLSGNVGEICHSFYNDVANAGLFSNTPGDGELDASGFHNNPHWPSHTGNQDYYNFLNRGGSWGQNTPRLRTSDRAWEIDNRSDERINIIGARGAR